MHQYAYLIAILIMFCRMSSECDKKTTKNSISVFYWFFYLCMSQWVFWSSMYFLDMDCDSVNTYYHFTKTISSRYIINMFGPKLSFSANCLKCGTYFYEETMLDWWFSSLICSSNTIVWQDLTSQGPDVGWERFVHKRKNMEKKRIYAASEVKKGKITISKLLNSKHLLHISYCLWNIVLTPFF